MGYYTRYTLEIENGDSNIISEFTQSCGAAYYALNDDGSPFEEVKWIEHEKDLKEFSLKYPDILFKLKGEGDAVEDIWIKYIKNGKCQPCWGKIIFEPFDESKLK